MSKKTSREKKPITNSKLKAVDTRNPEELRKSLREASNLSRLIGGQGNSPEQIERIIHLHCVEGLSLDDSVSKALDDGSDGVISRFRKRAERILKEREEQQKSGEGQD